MNVTEVTSSLTAFNVDILDNGMTPEQVAEQMMDYKIRELKQNEISVLNAFLYEAI